MKNKQIIELNKIEKIEIEGGVVAGIAAALGILSGVCLLAYGAGYLYGSIKCKNSSMLIPSLSGSISSVTL